MTTIARPPPSTPPASSGQIAESGASAGAAEILPPQGGVPAPSPELINEKISSGAPVAGGPPPSGASDVDKTIYRMDNINFETGDIAALTKEMKSLTEDMKARGENIKNLQAMIAGTQARAQGPAGKLAAIDKEIAGLDRNDENFGSKLAALEAKKAGPTAELEALKQTISNFADQIGKEVEGLEKLQKAADRLNTRMEEAGKNDPKMKEKLKPLKDAAQEAGPVAQANIDGLKSLIPTVMAAIQSINLSLTGGKIKAGGQIDAKSGGQGA